MLIIAKPEALNHVIAEIEALCGKSPDLLIQASGTAVYAAEDGCIRAAALRAPGVRCIMDAGIL
jgi:DNA-binding protein